VWNRQRTDHNETDPGDKRTSRGLARRWNPKDQWVISTEVAHPALVSEDDFVRAQAVSAVATPDDGQTRRYLLTGLVVCRMCGRRADAHWVHGRPGYRCRHGRTSANPGAPGGPKTLYVREDVIVDRISTMLVDRVDEASDGYDVPRSLASYLRANNVTITCDADTVTVEESASPTTARQFVPTQRPPPQPPQT
jgi:hypothetical protein